MSRRCPTCRRPNPSEAVYCYFDGGLLEGRGGGDIPADGSAMNIGARPFTVPFVLPSGQACTNFLQLAMACLEDSAAILELLRQGIVESFLAAQGRMDLATVARAAARSADRERGLDEFLSRLPVPLSAARLRVEPEALDLGTVQVGEDRSAGLTLVNAGKRLVYGSAGSSSPWLALGDRPALQNSHFQFAARSTLTVRVLGQQLGAYDKPREGQILLESSGGTITVPVRVYVPVEPFAEGALAGALSPRQAARKAKDAPREAAALIDSGAMARWYAVNGWIYPVRGPAATGVAALQQFLEALGLVKPPQVELSEDAIRLHGRPGAKIEYTLAVITQENRNVVAHGTSDQPWLVVGRPVFRGRSAFLPLTVSAVPDALGQTLQAQVTVCANGGQRLLAPVTLEVRAAQAEAALPQALQRPIAKPGVVSVPLPRPAARQRPTAAYRLIRVLLFLVVLLGLVILAIFGWHFFRDAAR